ncbi:signal peptidase I [Candidatus Nomurabacteria bacterium RIFCSPHIGHO2_02_FULL_41_18]|uniref:Signal peptidase I n=1 Tax=Candidatus Nomurabacteria bacterium RIFCSPHIGHO2_02_FULL_41_18 TaxID=1801754 RepID=A0A1F6W700_9BACT|nr:MAG: signal peptidase I [Candidatus Nomurabacteria bacterium RIFCSPHIGHO2_01_FULL_41_71]OGI77717.1 MAG: signal peptidase I [Candidatus Nomurabacteria bacterium RIFCSPHIGHO2_02_FULL_41_18]OGI89955.1 MAG: signal peptidase I [Candidatus Nomurabacteria bacterium RIFCSPLOWO2_01_FULL_41_52b]OGJ00451.1 MAG: signal peptidase I [Candidatus Nomurabacteria bacterium RIFCSPLOWO2_02_FULL_41_9]
MEFGELENKKESIGELVRFGLIAILIMVPIRLFVAQPFIVSGSSMFPTFFNGDYLIVDEISYRIKSPERFDVIIFRYPNEKKKFYIKRIIGLPGEKVEIRGSTVSIINQEYPDGLVLEQPYVKNKSDNNAIYELKENEYFVMGDNRSASSDSRYWGAVAEDLIMGRAFLRLLPVKNIDILPGYYKQAE